MQLSGPPPSYPEQQALVRHLAQAFQASGEFTLIEAIDQARVPVLKLQHAASSLKCDLSIGNELAVQKTRFLHAFVLRDSRVRPLCLIVKHCAPPYCCHTLTAPLSNILSHFHLLCCHHQSDTTASPPAASLLQGPNPAI